MDRYLLFARLVSRKPIRRAFAQHALNHAAKLTNLRCVSPGFFSFEMRGDAGAPSQVVELQFSGGRCRVGLPSALLAADRSGDQDRLLDALLVLSGCRDVGSGRLFLNIGDFGDVAGLAFSENRADYSLIPDPYYVRAVLARPLPQQFAERMVPWSQRQPLVFWRGSTSGNRRGPHWESLDRVRLCRIALADPARFDVGFTDIVQTTALEKAEISRAAMLREHVHLHNFDRWRYQLDIDGNSNSWGFFSKLLTGSPVLKVASADGYRQWYYERLIPWQHYVPVAADLSDLRVRVDWLLSHDAEARAIGAAARALTLSMTLQREIPATRRIVAEALRCASGPAA